MEAEEHLRSQFDVGQYSNSAEINQILHHQFAFFESKLEELLPQIASPDLLKFLLFQYEESMAVDSVYKSEQLNSKERVRWIELGPIFRRAVKYLAERVVMTMPERDPNVSRANLLERLDAVWICVEELTVLYTLSDQTFMVFPGETTFEILPRGEQKYWRLKVDNECAINMRERVFVDTANRERFVPQPSFEVDTERHDDFLAGAFVEEIGTTYLQAIGVLRTVIEVSEPDPNRFPIPFIHRETVIEKLCQYLGISRASVAQILAGFSLNKEQLQTEGRKVWKPKQEYRALRRGFFEVPHTEGIHLTFSKKMAFENLIQLVRGVPFQQLPTEWRTERIDLALSALANEAGTWFENVVQDNLTKVGFWGYKGIKRGFGQGDARVSIPENVGEVDYIGYSDTEQLLIVIECKMVSAGVEAKYFRDEISEFFTSSDAYKDKFEKKIGWVRSNLNQIIEAFESLQSDEVEINPTRMACAIITYYSSIITCLVEEIPSCSITEFMMSYEEKQQWPFERGIYSC